MYYINSLFVYSFLGFVMESTIYKIKMSKRHSGIFYGPITEVYGFGILLLLIIKILILDRLQCNWFIKLIITFVISWFGLTLVEFIGGNILNYVFHIDMWNYSKKMFHFGKYICLELSLVWGILGTIYSYYVKDKIDKFIRLIPKKVTIILVIINMIDTFFVLLYKTP